MKKQIFIAALAALAMSSCGKSNATTEAAENVGNDSVLVIYYSQTGATKAVAEEIAAQLGCDIAAIEAAVPYDGDYAATIARWNDERANNEKVEILPLDIELADYNTVFLGYPVWGGTYALPVATFLNDNSLEGKKVITFATFGSGGLETSTAAVQAAQPDAEVIAGYGVRNARVAKAKDEISRFLIENGYVEGSIEALPEFSESVAVTEADTNVFNEACGNYQFPLGTPVNVATRITPVGTEYRFNVESSGPDGTPATAVIYVIAPENEAPEFTRVVR